MIKPCYQDILVEVIYQEKRLENSRIILSDGLRKREGAFYGKIIEVGPDVKYGLKPGDKILFNRFEGFEVSKDGKEYIVLKPERLLAKLEGDLCNIAH